MPVFNLKKHGARITHFNWPQQFGTGGKRVFPVYLTVYRNTIARNNRFLNGHGHGCGN